VDEDHLPDPELLYHEILLQAERIQTLQAMARVRVQTDEQKASLDAVIACDGTGRLRFEVLDWLDHVMFLALFDGGGFLTYSVPDNHYVEGPDDPAEIQKILGIPLQAEELVALALGNPFFVSMTDPELRINIDQGVLLLDAGQPAGGERFMVWLDERRRPERTIAIRPNQGGRAVRSVEVSFGRYREIDSHVFPHRIRVTGVGSPSMFEVDYQKVILNEPLAEDLFQFVPPADATRPMD
jgi:hypothetical protein